MSLVWICKCGEIHTSLEQRCEECLLLQKETVFLGFTTPSLIGGVVNVAGMTTDAQKEIQWKAKVKCKASKCGAEEWVEWKDRHDSKCKKCWSKTEYTGEIDKK